MERTPTKRTIDDHLHGSPINHKIMCRYVRNQLKKLKSGVNLLLRRMTSEIGVDHELLANLGQNEDNDNHVIVVSSDIEAASKASKAVNQKTE
ncbi:hypothetical protein A4A49_52311 [Nicotiana attenuata]|uniref:Uncharacterized protein n=1 Tax=Nicotiana attenuata TaxID=49451 RepID=A0A1J6IKL1_NICAT|nr:hypothetical protein A4A49_52311 [Nicotiana attenuata]